MKIALKLRSMIASALATFFTIVLVIGVLRQPSDSNTPESRLEADWYDQP
jgi:hypothetical protein